MMLKPGKYNTDNLQAVFKSWKRHHSRSILDQSNQSTISFIISTAVLLQGQENESGAMANITAIKITDVKTVRNSNNTSLFFW